VRDHDISDFFTLDDVPLLDKLRIAGHAAVLKESIDSAPERRDPAFEVFQESFQVVVAPIFRLAIAGRIRTRRVVA
jgi:hypothetical protein